MKKILCIMVVFAFLLGSVSLLYAAEPKEKAKAEEKGKAAEPAKAAKVDINTATAEELCKLPGINKKIAEEIIAHRTKEPFKTIEDIKKVKGIGDKRYEKIKDQIEVKEIKKK
jgi:competence protein ComEA